MALFLCTSPKWLKALLGAGYIVIVVQLLMLVWWTIQWPWNAICRFQILWDEFFFSYNMQKCYLCKNCIFKACKVPWSPNSDHILSHSWCYLLMSDGASVDHQESHSDKLGLMDHIALMGHLNPVKCTSSHGWLTEHLWDHEHRAYRRSSQCDRLCVASTHPEMVDTPSTCGSHQIHHASKCLSAHSKMISY